MIQVRYQERCGGVLLPKIGWMCCADLSMTLFPSAGNKLSGVKLEQVGGNMSAVSLQVTPDWYKDPYYLAGWVRNTEFEPFTWKVS